MLITAVTVIATRLFLAAATLGVDDACITVVDVTAIMCFQDGEVVLPNVLDER
jgi:hypothetical protein